MTFRKMLAPLAVVLATCSAQAWAASDLLQIYNQARQNDARMASARAAFKASAETMTQSRSGLLPRVEASALIARHDMSKLKSNPSFPGSMERSQRNWSLSLSQPVFNLAAWFGLSGAGHLTDQARLQLEAEQQQLILRSAVAYFDVLRARDNLSVTEAQQKTAERELERAQQRFRAGLIAETDVHDARARYHSAQVAGIQARNQLTVAREQIRILTGKPPQQLAKLDKSMPVATPSPMNAEKWVQHALTHNLELQAARKGVDAARARVRAGYAGHAPVLTATASYSQNTESPASEANAADTSVQLQLTLPLFSGGATQSRAREAGYQLRQSEAQLDQRQREISTSARNLFHTVSADIEQIQARCQAIVSANSALHATKGGYDIGTRNVLDLLDAQQRLYGVQRDYLNARYDFIVNVLQLKQVNGSLSPSDLTDLNAWIKEKNGQDFPPACQ